ncbi:MAG: 50S ribosomal protein L29 [Candidatus Marinimicrobia bacterium]|nr:50S ribosomal protein L29 [Candidatus Neomarinimicrobiota bacterium]|tara:strand:+ start:2770 stop:2988 length:219 start_codon:yes stop_codon:yes gene_type:complete
MKKSKLRDMNQIEVNTKLEECMESLQNFRFQHTLQQLEDITLLSKTKKDIAQLKTILNEYKLGIRKNEGAEK